MSTSQLGKVTCQRRGDAGQLGNRMFQVAAAYVVSQNASIPCMLVLPTRWTAWTAMFHKGILIDDLVGLNVTDVDQNASTSHDTIIHAGGLLEKTGDVVNLQGYFQSWTHILPHTEGIRDLFRLNKDDEQRLHCKYIDGHAITLAIHVRRGDFLHASAYIELTKSWYARAIDTIMVSSRLQGPVHIVVCSDDIEWCRLHLSSVVEKIIPNVSIQFSSETQDIFDMYVMSYCTHKIISNSTFSWWSAFLGGDRPGLVVAPDRWFTTDGPLDIGEQDLLIPTWLQCPVTTLTRCNAVLQLETNSIPCISNQHDPTFSDIFLTPDRRLVMVGRCRLTKQDITVTVASVKLVMMEINDPELHTRLLVSNESITVDQCVCIEVNGHRVYPNVLGGNTVGKVVLATLVKNSSHLVLPWIKYHLARGVDYIAVYDNGSKDIMHLEEILAPWIKLGQVAMYNWPYQYTHSYSGHSGQTTQQNHALYGFRDAIWLGFIDIDEYFVPQLDEFPHDVRGLLDRLLIHHNVNSQIIGGCSFETLTFNNIAGQSHINHDFFSIVSCKSHTEGPCSRQKVFVIPSNVQLFTVHRITLGLPVLFVPPNDGLLNHYMFLNKSVAGGKEIFPATNTRIQKYLSNMHEPSTNLSLSMLFSFCLFGSDQKYVGGMTRNIECIRQAFPDAYVRIYVGLPLPPQKILDDFVRCTRVDVVFTGVEGFKNCISRWLPLMDDRVQSCFVRDADSRVSARDVWCIKQFLASPYCFHVIRDNHWHRRKIMAGLGGWVRDANKGYPMEFDFSKSWDTFLTNETLVYGSDEKFLAERVAPYFDKLTMVHTNISALKDEVSFPIEIPMHDATDFVGNVYIFDSNGGERGQFLAGDSLDVSSQREWLLSQNQYQMATTFESQLKPITKIQLASLTWKEICLKYDGAECWDLSEMSIQQSNQDLFASGYTIVATTDVNHVPREDEIIIVYGNYPLWRDSLPIVSRILFRHAKFFYDLKHFQVHSDPCFDQFKMIRIISLEGRDDRYLATLLELCRVHAPLDIVAKYIARKVDGISPYEGATQNHVDVIQEYVDSGQTGYCMVLEDDFSFVDLQELIKSSLNQLIASKPKFDVCFMAASRFHSREPYNDLLIRSLQECTTSSGYILSSDTASQVLSCTRQGLENMQRTGDTHINCIDRYWSRLSDMFIFRRKLGFQRATWSNLTNKVTNYLD